MINKYYLYTHLLHHMLLVQALWSAHWQNWKTWARSTQILFLQTTHPDVLVLFWVRGCCSTLPCLPAGVGCYNMSLKLTWYHKSRTWNIHCEKRWSLSKVPLYPLGRRFRCTGGTCSRRNSVDTWLCRNFGSYSSETGVRGTWKILGCCLCFSGSRYFSSGLLVFSI